MFTACERDTTTTPNPAGAGAALQRMRIEDSCRRGDRVIDLGPGSLDAKRKWQTQIAVAWRYTHYSLRSPRAQMLRAVHAVKALASRERGGQITASP